MLCILVKSTLLLWITILESLRGRRKFSGSRRLSDSDIPRADNANAAKLENYLFCSFAPFECFAQDIRIAVATLPRCASGSLLILSKPKTCSSHC